MNIIIIEKLPMKASAIISILSKLNRIDNEEIGDAVEEEIVSVLAIVSALHL